MIMRYPFQMELSPEEEFLLSDSSSSDDSDVETLFESRRQQMVVAVKDFEGRYSKQRQGSKFGRLCIPQNHFYGNELLMRDYFADASRFEPKNARSAPLKTVLQALLC